MSARWAPVLAVLMVSCAPPPGPPRVAAEPGAVRVRSELPLRRVLVRDGDGMQLARRDPGPDVTEVLLPVDAPEGTPLLVSVRRDDGEVLLPLRAAPAPGPLVASVDAPVGQGARPLEDGATLEVPVVGEGGTAAVVLRSERAGPARVTLGGEVRDVGLVAGAATVVAIPLPPGPAELRIEQGDRRIAARLDVRRVPLDEARASLRLVGVRLPTDAAGRSEPARAPGRVRLPPSWWRALLHRLDLGFRPRDPLLPWAHATVDLENASPLPLNVAVQLRILGPDGTPAPAFRPRMRATTGDTGVVSALVRVPAGGEATAALPLFVDDAALPEGASAFVREVSITPLGASEALWTDRAPLLVERGRAWVSLLFAAHLLAAALGWLLLIRRLPGWLRASRTADLTTLAVFATLTFVVSGASAVLGSVVGAVLGPFQGFLTALFDDALRYALLATLVTLLPRPGVVAATVIVAFLMRGVALGGFDPASVALLPARIVWLEGALWAVGLTRGASWTGDRPLRRWLRLGLGFSLASAASAAGALITQMVLYRLHYAGWYLVAIVLGPGFLYVWLACGLATGFSASLRAVES